MGINFGALLSENVKITRLSGVVSTGTTAVNATAVDMTGYRGVLFVSSLTTPAADNIMKAQQSADNSSFADLEGSAVDVGASDDTQWIDIYDPEEQYVRPSIARGTTTVVDSIFAIQYDPKGAPVSNVTAGTINGVALVRPAEGTA
jgi:hypothetical protein